MIDIILTLALIVGSFYLIYRLQLWKKQKQLEDIRSQMPYPFMRKTPLRLRLWNSIQYIYKTGNCSKFDAIYSLYAKSVLSFMHENYEIIFPNDLTQKYKEKIESEKTLLYILPYCYSYFLLDCYENHYNLPIYINVLEECNSQFVKDYTSTTGADYQSIIIFSKSQLELYFQTTKNNPHIPIHELKQKLRFIFIDDFMKNYLHTNYEGIRENLLACVSVFTILHLDDACKFAKEFCKEELMK